MDISSEIVNLIAAQAFSTQAAEFVCFKSIVGELSFQPRSDRYLYESDSGTEQTVLAVTSELEIKRLVIVAEK